MPKNVKNLYCRRKKVVRKKQKIEQSVLVVEKIIEKAPVPQNLPLYNQIKIHV